jgi:uncharacterized protein YbcI
MTSELSGETLDAISREMVRIKALHYGKGPSEAKTYQCDDFVFCVLRGGMTVVERTLLEHGDAELVRQVRMRFQANMDDSFKDAVARLTGRRVVQYQSQVMFDPDYVVEVFLLGPPLEGGPGRA